MIVALILLITEDAGNEDWKPRNKIFLEDRTRTAAVQVLVIAAAIKHK